jgi:hypothetical protein
MPVSAAVRPLLKTVSTLASSKVVSLDYGRRNRTTGFPSNEKLPGRGLVAGIGR